MIQSQASQRSTNSNLGELIRQGNFAQVQSHILQNPQDLECIAGRFLVSPFLRAAIHGQTKIAQFLVEQGCNIYFFDQDGYNAALLASYYGKLQFLQFLATIDTNLFQAKLSDKKSCVHLALQNKQYDMIRFLSQYIDIYNCPCDVSDNLLEFCMRNYIFNYIKNLVADFQIPYDYIFVGKLSSYLTKLGHNNAFYKDIVRFLTQNKMWIERRNILFIKKRLKCKASN